jgi:hypothetical protein
VAKKKTSGRVSKSKAAPKSKSKSGKAKKAAPRMRYADSLKKKVVSAIKKGMTHSEASKSFSVGIHSIPNWIRAAK